jgi:hypothetical protein
MTPYHSFPPVGPEQLAHLGTSRRESSIAEVRSAVA